MHVIYFPFVKSWVNLLWDQCCHSTHSSILRNKFCITTKNIGKTRKIQIADSKQSLKGRSSVHFHISAPQSFCSKLVLHPLSFWQYDERKVLVKSLFYYCARHLFLLSRLAAKSSLRILAIDGFLGSILCRIWRGGKKFIKAVCHEARRYPGYKIQFRCSLNLISSFNRLFCLDCEHPAAATSWSIRLISSHSSHQLSTEIYNDMARHRLPGSGAAHLPSMITMSRRVYFGIVIKHNYTKNYFFLFFFYFWDVQVYISIDFAISSKRNIWKECVYFCRMLHLLILDTPWKKEEYMFG